MHPQTVKLARPYSTVKLIRGLQKIWRGVAPDLFINWSEQRRRERWRKLLLRSDETITIRIGSGINLELPKSLDISKLLILDNFEQGERKLLRQILRKGDIFIDIGANVGLFSIIASKAVGASGRVFSIEPSPRTFCILTKQVIANGLKNVTSRNLGISSCNGRLKLNECNSSNGLYASFGRPISNSEHFPTEVPVLTLDEFIASEAPGTRIALIKIDVEGWEPEIIKGGTKTLSGDDAPDLIIEYCEAALTVNSANSQLLFLMIQSLGYDQYEIDPSSGILSFLPVGRDFEYRNVFATKAKL